MTGYRIGNEESVERGNRLSTVPSVPATDTLSSGMAQASQGTRERRPERRRSKDRATKGSYWRLVVAGLAGVLLLAGLWLWLKPDGNFLSGNSKTNCVYPDDSRAALATLEAAAGTTFNCVLLYNDSNPTWADWTNVWWASSPSPDTNWLAWKRAVPGRRIII